MTWTLGIAAEHATTGEEEVVHGTHGLPGVVDVLEHVVEANKVEALVRVAVERLREEALRRPRS